MAKIKLHNPELAKNSKFSNLVLESLTSDPTLNGVESVGRLWFNNTDKTFKGGFLDADGTNVEIKPIGIDNSADVEANTEAIEQEIVDRTSADTTLQTNIDSEISRATATEGDISALTTDDTTNLVTAINEVDANTDINTASINTEISRAISVEGDLATLTTTDKTNLVTAINEVDANTDINTASINTEMSRATSVEGDISALTTDDTTNLVAAINEVDANTDINTTAISNIVDDLSTNYLNKTSSDSQVVTAETTFSNNLIIQGDLTVSGTTTTIETETLKVADNIITLNDGIGDVDPTENAGIEVDRGNEGLTTILQWNETLDQVEIQSDGSLKKVATEDYVDTADNILRADIDTISSDLSTEITNRTNADDNLQSNIDTEATTRSDADASLDSRITDLETQIDSKIGDLSDLTTDAQDTLVNAINEVDSNIDGEVSNRINADSAIQSEIDRVETGAGLNDDGTYVVEALTNYISSATSVHNATVLLDTSIKTNEDSISSIDIRVTNIESQVDGKIGDLSDLTTDAQDTLVNAINEVDANLNSEVTRATTAETNLQTAIDDESTTRFNNDDALSTRIDNINIAAGISDDTYTSNSNATYITSATSLYDSDNILDSAIKTNYDNLIATTSGNGTNYVGYDGYTESDTNIVNPTIELNADTLKNTLDNIASLVNTKINDIENRYVKGEVAEEDAADTYTVAHNLNTEFVDVSVQVYDASESVWRFDLVVTEVIDVNTVKISLASGDAEQIRYVIQGY